MIVEKIRFAICAVLLISDVLQGQTQVNPDAALVQAFEDRIGAYVKLEKTAAEGLPPLKAGNKKGDMQERRQLLAARLREVRSAAKQGDICTPDIAAELRRLIGLAMQGRNSSRVRKSLKSAEPVLLALKINGPFPEKLPLQSTPPTLLLNLPALPAEVDYRLVGNALVIRDCNANIILDFVPNALPPAK